jgi:hypothetical protein
MRFLDFRVLTLVTVANRSASASTIQFCRELGEEDQYANRQQCANHTNKKQLLLIP